MKNLSVFAVSNDDHLVKPEEFEDISASSPALSIVTDFRKHTPHMVNGDEVARAARQQMEAGRINHKLVVDNQGELIGIVNLALLSQHNLQLKQSLMQIKPSELTVRDLMISRKDIQAIEYSVLEGATVGDVIGSLQKSGEEYFLVVDSSRHHIRGVVSSDMIAERLHVPVYVERRVSFFDIFRAVAAH
jgi:CBS domain containing-hemolysin-like protein